MPGHFEKTVENLLSDDWLVRRAACRELGKLGDTRAIDPLFQLLWDPNPPVRLAATDALGQLGHPRSVVPLIRRLDDYKQIRRAICKALGLLGQRIAVPVLIQRVNDKSPSVCFAAYKSLGQLGDPRALHPLLRKLGHSDWHVREAICKALGNLGDMRAVESLIQMLYDTNAKVRRAACMGLEQLGESSAADRLILVLNDTDWSVRKKACSALGKLGVAHAIIPLIQMLNDTDSDVRATAQKALDEFGEDAVVDDVIEALELNTIKRDQLTETTEKKELNGLDPLIQALGSSDQTIRRFAYGIKKTIYSKLKPELKHCLCSDHLTRFEIKKYRIDWRTIARPFVCRVCGLASGMLPDIKEVVAVLDNRMEEDFIIDGDTLRGNWISVKAMFDFDRIEIVSASDDDVELLCNNFKNDTDPFRLKLRKSMQCTISPDCELTGQARDLLKSTFQF